MTDWDRLVGIPLAPHTDPFPGRGFLELVSRFGPTQPEVVATGAAAIAVVMSEGTVRFAGEHHLTDYHSPLGSDLTGLLELLMSVDAVRLDLDSMPEEAAAAVATGLAGAGRTVERHDDESARYIDLSSAGPEGWETILRSKDRHEVRRKRRKYESEVGEPTLGSGREYFDDFVALHRLAAGDKGGFMSEEMESFFSDLLGLPETRLDVLLTPAGVGAAAFGFESDSGYSLYNSAYDPGMSEVSPGIVLTDLLIARSLDVGHSRFDFLKGDEVYKQRLGAVVRPLVRMTVDL